ncbi:MAG: 1,4-alpha-glucan branching protein GlgB [Desulfotomaculum sp.]|nr:1,4-alpha-glucan branching protein GlgB [Desulfotomaculum sp.]
MTVHSITEYNQYLFNEGTHYFSYKKLGAHLTICNDIPGVQFSVWAPNARNVRVVGDFNNWDGSNHSMKKLGLSGIWSLFIPEAQKGDLYKYEIHTCQGKVLLKSDPYAFYSELRPRTASVVYPLKGYSWSDGKWQKSKTITSIYEQPILIYELHLGSWKRGEKNDFLSCIELADQLINYVKKMGYTHIELLPILEHPYDGSWGYQVTGYYSVTSRYGCPHDFMYFVDKCHQNGIGVILDWVPGHFCNDQHGLRRFDGTPLYESSNYKKSENKEWGTTNFDFSRPEVWSFLISNALFWLDVYHVDGLRVDAVSNMLYLDYGKEDGEWVPNDYGGKENIEAINFLRKLNEVVFHYFPHTLMLAEESTQWPQVTKPTYVDGLGFNYKWNMGWMNDILSYMKKDPVYRRWHHNELTFSIMYSFSENFVLPISHDEVVHGKKSLLDKMPGDYWQKFANLRTLYAYMIAHPGKKLIFMGAEFGQFIEWRYDQSLDWHLLDYEMHQKLQHFFCVLNYFYRREKSLWELDNNWTGFQWIDPHDSTQSIITFMRRAKKSDDFLIVICNFTPVARHNYRIGVPYRAEYEEVFNSDLQIYGGSGVVNKGVLKASDDSWHNQPYCLEITIPPLAAVFIKPQRIR